MNLLEDILSREELDYIESNPFLEKIKDYSQKLSDYSYLIVGVLGQNREGFIEYLLLKEYTPSEQIIMYCNSPESDNKSKKINLGHGVKKEFFLNENANFENCIFLDIHSFFEGDKPDPEKLKWLLPYLDSVVYFLDISQGITKRILGNLETFKKCNIHSDLALCEIEKLTQSNIKRNIEYIENNFSDFFNKIITVPKSNFSDIEGLMTEIKVNRGNIRLKKIKRIASDLLWDLEDSPLREKDKSSMDKEMEISATKLFDNKIKDKFIKDIDDIEKSMSVVLEKVLTENEGSISNKVSQNQSLESLINDQISKKLSTELQNEIIKLHYKINRDFKKFFDDEMPFAVGDLELKIFENVHIDFSDHLYEATSSTLYNAAEDFKQRGGTTKIKDAEFENRAVGEGMEIVALTIKKSGQDKKIRESMESIRKAALKMLTSKIESIKKEGYQTIEDKKLQVNSAYSEAQEEFYLKRGKKYEESNRKVEEKQKAKKILEHIESFML